MSESSELDTEMYLIYGLNIHTYDCALSIIATFWK